MHRPGMVATIRTEWQLVRRGTSSAIALVCPSPQCKPRKPLKYKQSCSFLQTKFFFEKNLDLPKIPKHTVSYGYKGQQTVQKQQWQSTWPEFTALKRIRSALAKLYPICDVGLLMFRCVATAAATIHRSPCLTSTK